MSEKTAENHETFS